HSEHRVADFFFAVEADAQFLHAAVKIDTKEVGDALKEPDDITDSDGAHRSRDRGDDHPEHYQMEQHGLAARRERRADQQSLAAGQRMTIADHVVEDARARYHEQSGRQQRNAHQDEKYHVLAVGPDERANPRYQAEHVAGTEPMRIGKLDLGD